jgi:hypothetical protein
MDLSGPGIDVKLKERKKERKKDEYLLKNGWPFLGEISPFGDPKKKGGLPILQRISLIKTSGCP